MLATITFTLKSQNSGSLPELPGRFLHAAVFFLFSSADEDAGKFWDDFGSVCIQTLSSQSHIMRNLSFSIK